MQRIRLIDFLVSSFPYLAGFYEKKLLYIPRIGKLQVHVTPSFHFFDCYFDCYCRNMTMHQKELISEGN